MEGYSLLMQTMLASAATFIGVLLFNRSHRREFRVAAFVALALFVAQIGAIAHSYTHQPSTGTSTYQKIANNHEFCADCLNFAPLLAAAGTPALLPVSLQFTQSPPPPAPPASFLDHRSYLAFRSRAPPVTR
ncbi:MAG TPA: hypothetical protein VHW71_03130 [Steroidobacteraceae bacterium]|nr:hypothetical protein [Steroidobacteraceae bacterium]